MSRWSMYTDDEWVYVQLDLDQHYVRLGIGKALIYVVLIMLGVLLFALLAR